MTRFTPQQEAEYREVMAAKAAREHAEDIALMRRTVGPRMGVKASGGVRSLADARKMIEHGATRIGTSSGVAIVTGGTGSGY